MLCGKCRHPAHAMYMPGFTPIVRTLELRLCLTQFSNPGYPIGAYRCIGARHQVPGTALEHEAQRFGLQGLFLFPALIAHLQASTVPDGCGNCDKMLRQIRLAKPGESVEMETVAGKFGALTQAFR